MNMKNILILLALSATTTTFAAEETCYQVSTSNTAWSKSPESLCVTESNAGDAIITLKSGLPFNEQVVAKFNLTLLGQARCMDCNANVYGVANPSNSSFNALAIVFDGKINMSTREESGTVSIGKTKLFYRTFPR